MNENRIVNDNDDQGNDLRHNETYSLYNPRTNADRDIQTGQIATYDALDDCFIDEFGHVIDEDYEYAHRLL